MSATQKLKWKKIANQLRYMYEELDIVSAMSSEAAVEFQEYYEEYCRRNDIDIAELNRLHAERIEQMYGADNHVPNNARPHASGSGSTAMAPLEEEPPPRVHLADGDAEEYVAIGDDTDMHEIFSKLFKKLAQHLHPDKLTATDLTDEEKSDMLSMFTNAKTALDEKRYFILIDYATRLGIPLPKNYKQQTRWMRREIEMVRERIGVEMRSYNYMFAEADSDDTKDQLIKKFLHQLFGMSFSKEET